MPSWTLLSLALAVVPPPSVATCANDPDLPTLLADPTVAEIELEPGCEHAINSGIVDRPVVVRGQAPATGQTRPRIVFPPSVANDELLHVVNGGDLVLEAVDLNGFDGGAQAGGRALNIVGGAVHLTDVSADAFDSGAYGGVFYVASATLTVDGGSFRNNTALYGGVV